jgi:ubiquinone/menaquinone biosynthesis C-methylase UbiE
MKNYDRYKSVTSVAYGKKGIMDYLAKIPSDKKLIPLISQIKDKNILDVGLGTGYYTRFLIEDNEITGIDQNPHLCKLPIKVYKGDAIGLCQTGKGGKIRHSFLYMGDRIFRRRAIKRLF